MLSLNSINICWYNNNGTVVADIAPICFCNVEYMLYFRVKKSIWWGKILVSL